MRVRAAATEMAADCGVDIISGWIRFVLQQRSAAHDHSWGAEAALQGVMYDECGLHRVKLVASCQSLDRRHAASAHLDCQHHAGADGGAVEPDRTG